jgi:hypothetical protein
MTGEVGGWGNYGNLQLWDGYSISRTKQMDSHERAAVNSTNSHDAFAQFLDRNVFYDMRPNDYREVTLGVGSCNTVQVWAAKIPPICGRSCGVETMMVGSDAMWDF